MTVQKYDLVGLTISELSGVDFPAQEPALVVCIHKRKEQETTMTTTADQDRTKYLETELAKALKSNDQLTTLVSLSAEERAHYDHLPAPAREIFLGKSAADRTADVAKAKDADPVIYTHEGIAIRKSQDPTGLLVATLKRNAEQDELIRKEREAREDVELEKRALVLKNLPQELAVHKALLKAVEGIKDETLRKGALELLNAANGVFAKGQQPLPGPTGASGGVPRGNAEQQLEELTKRRMSEHKETYPVAYSKTIASDEGKALYKRYEEERTAQA